MDRYRISQIRALLTEGHGIKAVARMTGVSRNTVRRYQRNIPPKGRHGKAWRAMEVKQEDIKKLFYAFRDNCSAMHRFVEDTINADPPSLRTLQKFCMPFRLELRQSRLTKTERSAPPQTSDADRFRRRRCLRGRRDRRADASNSCWVVT